MNKITKKNSIIFNQLWITKLIEDQNMRFLPCKNNSTLSIGEIIEYNYDLENEQEPQKVTESNSILYEQEWIEKYKEEGLSIPKYGSQNFSLGQLLALHYIEKKRLEKLSKKSSLEKIFKIDFNRK